MKKKSLVPRDILNTRAYIDGAFVGANGRTADEESLPWTWRIFTRWIERSRSDSLYWGWDDRPAANDDLAGDELRLIAIEKYGIKLGLTRSDLDAGANRISQEFRKDREEDERRVPRFKHIVHSLVVGYRAKADGDLSSFTPAALSQLRLNFSRWIRGPREISQNRERRPRARYAVLRKARLSTAATPIFTRNAMRLQLRSRL